MLRGLDGHLHCQHLRMEGRVDRRVERGRGRVPSQFFAISSYHFSSTFSKESRESTAKQSMMTCVSA